MANYDSLYKAKEVDSKNDSGKRLMARFIKYGKLVWEHNPIKVRMGVESSAGDLLTKSSLKNTDATSPFHNDQCNPPKATQICKYHKRVKYKRHAFFGCKHQ